MAPKPNLIFGLSKESLKSLFGAAGVYGGANLLGALVPFVLLPFFTRHMSPSDYGLSSMYQVLAAIFTPIVGLSLHGAIGRRHVDRDSIDFPLYVTICLKIALASFATTSLVVVICSSWIHSITSFPPQWLWAPLAVAGAQAVCQSLLAIWQMEERPVAYALFQGLMLIGQFAVSYYFVVVNGTGWTGSVLGHSGVAIVFALIGAMLLWREGWLRRGLNWSYVKHAVKFGFPLIPHVLGAWVLTMVDRVLVTKIAGLGEAGIYAVGVQFGLAMSLLTTSFNQGWVPWLYSKLKKNSPAELRQVVSFTYWYSLALLLVAGFIALTAPLVVPHIVGSQYAGAVRFIPWIALGYAFNGMYKMVTNYIFYVEKTHLLAWVTFGSGCLNVALSYFLVTRIGALGGAISAAISFLISFLATWILAARVFEMPWSLRSNKGIL